MSRASARARHNVGEKGRAPIVDYNAVQTEGSTNIDADRCRLEFWIAKQIGTDLTRTYPNREWSVTVDTENGVIIIQAPALSKAKGYHVHIKRDTIAQLIPRCRTAAAEILERFGVERSRIIDPSTLEAFDRNFKDDVVETTDNRADPLTIPDA